MVKDHLQCCGEGVLHAAVVNKLHNAVVKEFYNAAVKGFYNAVVKECFILLW